VTPCEAHLHTAPLLNVCALSLVLRVLCCASESYLRRLCHLAPPEDPVQQRPVCVDVKAQVRVAGDWRSHRVGACCWVAPGRHTHLINSFRLFVCPCL
jgi:hypothetical protein